MKSTGTSRREVEMGTDPSVKSTDGKLLEIRNLKTYFYTEEGVVRAVDGVSVAIAKGKSLGLVGESGCGKTVTALSVLRLIPIPPGKIPPTPLYQRGARGRFWVWILSFQKNRSNVNLFKPFIIAKGEKDENI